MKNRIEQIRKKKNLTIKVLSERSGLTEQTIFRVMSGKDCREITKLRISQALEEKIKDVFYF